ncbi:MAG: 16S rRNA (cytosine(1402)-N(4))-methyltransferase RsmH [Betaproteobacteria bacterium]|nr:16S rRNA (cytosine(1402)-N(4))-methyltransferase RsmH [Betaproteobacteria bacterium]
MTSSSQHFSVLLDEAIEALQVRADGFYVDGTFGRGGHSRAILARLGAAGRLIALDKDPAAVKAASRIADPRFTIVKSGFARLAQVVRGLGVAQVDGVLLDIGVSSPQLEDASRGFSFRSDGPLDMRMDASQGRTAAEWLATASERELEEVIRTYGEERFAKQIAGAVVAERARRPVATTRQLAQIVAKAVKTREPGQDPATRTFQALRIYLNQELEELSLVLPQAVDLLKPGGRLAVISFHSLEDRIVKRFLREQSAPPKLPRKLPVREAELPRPRMRTVGKPVRPGPAEVAANPRARSAIMRVGERTSEP